MRVGLVVCLAACGRASFDPRPRLDAATDPSLVAHYTFDGTDMLADLTGTHRLTCSDCPIQTGGYLGSAASFSGTQCLVIPDALALRPSLLSVATWFTVPTTLPSADLVARSLDGATSVSNTFELEYGKSSNIPQVTAHLGPTFAGLTRAPIEAGGWRHVAAVFDGATLTLFIGGIQVASSSSPPFVYAADDYRLGCDFDNGVIVNRLVGSLDDVRIYNRALSQAEVLALASM
jgi:hypothetical protein